MFDLEIPNTLPLLLMIAASFLGAFDTLYYHIYKFRLYDRPQSRGEVMTHLVRVALFGIGAFLLSNYRPLGGWYWAIAGLFALDFVNSIADVVLEPRSRAPLGGLPPGEYVVHILGTALEGAMAASFLILFWQFRGEATALQPLVEGTLPAWLQFQGKMLVAGSVFIALLDGGLFIRSVCQSRTDRAVQYST